MRTDTLAIEAGATERAFSIDELFFSTTDRRGVVTAGNDVFVRVSGYDESELVGRPHNLVRHPHTPKAVFRLLWSYLEADRPIFAYVKNRAKDGSPYWVGAIARPVGDGYLSVRLKPSTALSDAARDVYHSMCQVEADTPHDRPGAMDASSAVLDHRLAALGFADYDAFMRAALVREVTARRDAIRSSGAIRPASQGRRNLLGSRLDGLLDDVAQYQRLNEQLATASAVLVDIAEEGKLLALNTVLAARRLGAGGEAITAVAHALRETFPTMASHAHDVVQHITDARRSLERASFSIALAVIQHDMVDIVDTESRDRTVDRSSLLHDCLQADVAAMTESIGDMLASIGRTIAAAAALEHDLLVLATIERNGRIEAARVNRVTNLTALLDQIKDRVVASLTHTRNINALAYDLDRLRTDEHIDTRAAEGPGTVS